MHITHWSSEDLAWRAIAEGIVPAISTATIRRTSWAIGFARSENAGPLKKIPETDAIFEEIHGVNEAADEEDGVVRISLDTKATVKVGPFSRGGFSRQEQRACDHDFQPASTLTPFGVLLPQTGESHLWFTEGKVTADSMVDRLGEMVPR